MYTEIELTDMLKSDEMEDVKNAQVSLYERYADKISSKARYKGFPQDEASDLVWDAIEAVTLSLRKKPEFYPEKLEAYVMGTVRILLIHKHKARVKERNMWSESNVSMPEVAVYQRDDSISKTEAIEQFCLQTLSEKCRMILSYKYLPHLVNELKPLSWDAIAEKLGYANSSSVKVASTTCKRNLKACLQAKFPSMFEA
ncbi:MAG: RNA polymerase sigma factor [Bacteroidia bacterium]